MSKCKGDLLRQYLNRMSVWKTLEQLEINQWRIVRTSEKVLQKRFTRNKMQTAKMEE